MVCSTFNLIALIGFRFHITSSAEESESVAAATKKSQRMSCAVPLFTPFSKASIAIHLMRFQTSLRTGFWMVFVMFQGVNVDYIWLIIITGWMFQFVASSNVGGDCQKKRTQRHNTHFSKIFDHVVFFSPEKWGKKKTWKNGLSTMVLLIIPVDHPWIRESPFDLSKPGGFKASRDRRDASWGVGGDLAVKENSWPKHTQSPDLAMLKITLQGTITYPTL